MKHLRTLGLALLLCGLIGCSGDEPTQASPHGLHDATLSDTDGTTDPSDSGIPGDAANAPDTSVPSGETRLVFTHKMMKKTGENPFASLAYECQECTFEQWESIVAPQGWSKGPAQNALFSASDSLMRSYPSVEGHPDSVDFLEEVPGNEYKVIAVTLSGRLVENGPNGIVAEVQVRRDTRLVFTAGMRVHELTDPEGNVFVLFVHHFDTGSGQAADFQAADALDYFTAPAGWTYSTRILDAELALDSDNSEGVVTVLAIRGSINSTWEKR